MRRLAVALAVGMLVACGDPRRVEPEANEVSEIPSPRFADPELQAIATRLVNEADRRGIRTIRGRWNRVESLIQLEAELGGAPAVLQRVNLITIRAVQTDSGYWAAMRSSAVKRCQNRDDETCTRVRDLIERWYRHRLTVVTNDLGDESRIYRYGGYDWEKHFHEFVRRVPRDAATWAWIVSREGAEDVRSTIGRNDSEAAYRYYLAVTRLGTRYDAAALFSVPGVEIRER